jgi:hypothetical protein
MFFRTMQHVLITAAASTCYLTCMCIAGQWDISGLYGAVPLDVKPIDGVPPELYNKMLQVSSEHIRMCRHTQSSQYH